MVILPWVLWDDVHKLFGRVNNTCGSLRKIPFSWFSPPLDKHGKTHMSWRSGWWRCSEHQGVEFQLFCAKDKENGGRKRWRWTLQAGRQALGWVLHKAGRLIPALQMSSSLRFREVTNLRSQKQPWGGVGLGSLTLGPYISIAWRLIGGLCDHFTSNVYLSSLSFSLCLSLWVSQPWSHYEWQSACVQVYLGLSQTFSEILIQDLFPWVSTFLFWTSLLGWSVWLCLLVTQREWVQDTGRNTGRDGTVQNSMAGQMANVNVIGSSERGRLTP